MAHDLVPPTTTPDYRRGFFLDADGTWYIAIAYMDEEGDVVKDPLDALTWAVQAADGQIKWLPAQDGALITVH